MVNQLPGLIQEILMALAVGAMPHNLQLVGASTPTPPRFLRLWRGRDMEREGKGDEEKEKAIEYIEETCDLLAYFSYRLGY